MIAISLHGGKLEFFRIGAPGRRSPGADAVSDNVELEGCAFRPGTVLDQPRSPVPGRIGLLKPDDHLGDVFEGGPPQPVIGVLHGVPVYLVGNDHRHLVAFRIPEEVDHLPGESLHRIPAFFEVSAVECGRRVHDEQSRFLCLDHVLRFEDHRCLVPEIDRFEEEEPVRKPFGICTRNLPEPLDGKPFGIDVDHRVAGPQAGDRGDHAQGALAACRFTVDLGDGPHLETAPDQGVKGCIPARPYLCFHQAPRVFIRPAFLPVPMPAPRQSGAPRGPAPRPR